MTVLVGVRCSDGVVIGSDSVATSSMGSFPLMHIAYPGKLSIFSDAVIVATTGSVGYAQRLHPHIEAAVKGGVFANLDVRECANNVSKRFITELGNSLAPRSAEGLGFGALIAAAPPKTGPFLAEFGLTDFQPEIKDDKLFFVSMGSGQVLADPFLAFVTRVLWKGQMPSVDDAKIGVYWVLEHTLKLAPGKVGPPIRIATLRQEGGNWIAKEQDTQESAQYVAELENHIGQFVRAPVEQAQAIPIPPPPAVAE